MLDNNKLNYYRSWIIAILFASCNFIVVLGRWSEFSQKWTILHTFYNFYQVLIILLLFPLYLTSKPTFKNLFLFLIITFLGVINSIKNDNFAFLLLILFFFGSINTDTNNIFKVDLFSRIICFILIIFSYVVGYLPDITINRGFIIRHSLGFVHPNALMYVFILIVFEIIVVRRNNFSIFEAIALIACTLFFGNVSDGRGGEYSSIFACVLAVIIKYVGSEKIQKFIDLKIVKNILIMLPEIYTLFSYCVFMLVKPGTLLYNTVNNVVSERLSIIQFYFSLVGLHLFPVNLGSIYYDNSNNNLLVRGIDGTYLYLLIFSGFILLLIYNIIISYLIHNAIIYGEIYLLLIIIILSTIGIVESILYPYFCFVIVSYKRANYNNF